MTQIIGFSGKKQSGKTTSCNFILGYVMSNLGVVRGTFDITQEGKLHITDIFGDESHEGIFDYFRPGKAMDEFKKAYLDKHIKIYSFADILKKEVGMNILGLTYEQVYGSDEDKNTLTNIKWSDCPGVIIKNPDEHLEGTEVAGRLGKYYDTIDGAIYHEDGFMTAREVLQYIGTDVFRRMVPDCWANAVIRKIQDESPGIALICDCRFPNEVKAIQTAGGIVARLTLNSDCSDYHSSETALDGFNEYDFEIDNATVGIADANGQIYQLMVELGLVETEVQA